MSARTCGNRIAVIGAGPAGMLCAGSLAANGCAVTLLERSETPGGLLQKHSWFYPQDADIELIRNNAILSGKGHPGITVHPGASVTGVAGQAGRFEISYTSVDGTAGAVGADCIVVATGYDVDDITDTATEYEGTPASVLLVCTERNRAAFAALAARALDLRSRYACETTVVTPEMKVGGDGLELLVNRAHDAGVLFIKTDEPADVVETAPGTYTVRVTDPVLDAVLVFEPDALVTSGCRRPAGGTDALVTMLRIRTDAAGYLQTDNSQNGSVETGRMGVFVCGGCRYPGDGEDVVRDVRTVAARVAALAGTVLEPEPGRSRIDAEKCRLCLTCYRTCPHAAIDVDRDKESAVIDDAVCAACGTCIGACPAGAIAEVTA